jgi:membrane-associated phospholipid phosphatase
VSCLSGLFHESRPFFYTVDLRTYTWCPRGFGFPSIHAVADAAFYPYLVVEVYHQRKAWLPSSFNRTARRRVVWILLLEGTALATVLVGGTAQMVLGIHFPYQVCGPRALSLAGE